MTVFTSIDTLVQSGILYGKIYMDLPWKYKSQKPTTAKRPSAMGVSMNADYYYPTMTIDEMKTLPINQISAKNSVLFEWVTNPFLQEGLELMKYFGFKYVTMITWNKSNGKGGGYWFRGMTEHLLFGVKGKVKSFRSMTKNIQEAKITKHSEKPDLFRKIIESVGVDLEPKLEMFARQEFQGWNQYGNQVKQVTPLEAWQT